MKKIVLIIFLLISFMINVDAKSGNPKYCIIASSNSNEDIEELYNIKNCLINDYREWSEGVDNKEQTLIDHVSNYNATYDNHIYKIILGDGKGKKLTGELKVNYCESSEQIKKRSFILDLFS